MAISLTHPLPGRKQTGYFGNRPAFWENGIYIPAMFHNGADFGAPAGTPIRAAHTGKVTFVGWDNGGGGWSVQITGSFGRTFYCHMREKSTDVHLGQNVSAGQTIGRVGMSGTATGNHLHFMLDLGRGWVDPVPYLNNTTPPNPTPPAIWEEEEDEMATPVYIQDKATAGQGSIYRVLSNGRKRIIPKLEWEAIRSQETAAAQAGYPAPVIVGLVSAAHIAGIPNA